MVRDTSAIPGLQDLWNETLGHPDVCVAILDGPVDRTHPSLVSANLNLLETMSAGVPDQGLATQHGTHVTSIIFGQHDGPVKGIAPHCRGIIAPIFSVQADGSIAPCSQIDLARAITQVVQAGAQIINISGGEYSPSGTAHPILAKAIQDCVEQGILIVAAAGNEGCECLHIPGAMPAVLAVGAMDRQNRPLGFSNWGPIYRSQGILAPGEDILGAVPGGGTSLQSGTSYATAIVSGIAASLLGLQRRLGKKPDPHAVRMALLESANPCDPQETADCRPFLVGSLNLSGAYSTILMGKQERKVKAQDMTQTSTKTGLRAGDMAPDFMVKDHTGRNVRLGDYRGKTVVLWFYPQADTPG